MRDSRNRHTNLTMAWVDYRKAYDMVPHSWIAEILKIMKVSVSIRQFLVKSMKGWKTMLESGGQELGEVRIQRGIFQGDSLSPLIFVMCMVPLTEILRDVNAGYVTKSKSRINHLLYMDDLKLFAKINRSWNLC